MKRALSQPLRTAAAAIYVLRASARAAWWEPRLDLPELICKLKTVPARAPRLELVVAEGVLERLLPLLPPFGTGACVKRSLILLDLWSRRGLDPRFHLGIRASARLGHAWVSANAAPQCPPGVLETWSL